MNNTKISGKGALSHLKVLDLSRVLAAPFCAQMLGDLGADVIKVERPGSGDDTRSWPPFISNEEGQVSPTTTYFICANRNKRSLTVNLSKPEGQALIKEMIKDIDILLENFKAGDMARFGLDYSALSQINPRLIYCSVTGFGHSNSRSHLPGYDIMIQGLSGLMSTTGTEESGPLKSGVSIADLVTGLNSFGAIMAALESRHITGIGEYIDMSLFDCALSILAGYGSSYLNNGKLPQLIGNSHPSLAPYQAFVTQDSNILIAVANDSQFTSLCNNILQEPNWATDERFISMELRVKNRIALIDLLAHRFAQRSSQAWINDLNAHNIPCGLINNIAQAFNEPAAIERKSLIKFELNEEQATQAGIESINLIASPLNLKNHPPSYRYPPPFKVGAHTEEILKEWGFDDKAIQALKQAKAI